MNIEIIDDKINITDKNGIILENLHPVFKYDGGNYNLLSTFKKGLWKIEQIGEEFVIKCDNFEYFIKPGEKSLQINCTFIADKNYNQPVSFDSFNCFYKSNITRVIWNTFDNYNNLRCNAMCSTVNTIALVEGQVAESGDNVFAEDENGNYFSLGATSFNKYFTEQNVCSDGKISFLNRMEVHPLKKGEIVKSEQCFLFFDSKIHDIICGYSNECVKKNNIKKQKFSTPIGFCTWYYYGNKITQKQIYENLNFYYKNKKDFPIEYFQIDDGWENNRGDWKENEKFSDGMKKIAYEITEKGFKPGIWLAPFKVDEDSELFKQHPDFLVKNKDGTLFKGFDNTYCFDFSNDKASDYMYDLFHKISYDWGYRYIKIDLINISVPPLCFSKENFTALENIKTGLNVIRSAVTNDTFILSCTSPLAPLMGWCDGMRVSVYIFERWDSLKEVFKSVFKRYYYNDNFFINDADCLIMRKAENEDDECWRLCTRTDEEIKTYITAMVASGGIFMIGDKLMNFSFNQKEMLKKIFPINKKTAVPIDIMESDIPSVLDFGIVGENRIVAFFNWSEKEKQYSFYVGNNMQAFEFWEQKYYGNINDNLNFKVLPHNVKLFYISSSVNPCVVGTNDTIIADISQNYERKMLRSQFIKGGEVQFVLSNKKMFCLDDVEIKEERFSERYLYKVKNINNIPGYLLIEK